MSKQINVGLVGAGWLSWQHIQGYRKLDGVKVLAICDINEALLNKIADEYNIPKRFTKYTDMLALDKLDAISVCTPNYLHVPQTIEALESGKHVICEKPLSVNAEEAEKIVKPLEKSKKVFMIAQIMRFLNESKYLKQLINKNELGKIYYAKAKYLRRHGIPGIGSWFTTKKYSGGGSLIDCGVHILDQVWWLMGCPEPVEMFGSTYAEFGPRGLRDSGFGVSRNRTASFDVEDLATGIIKFNNAATLFLGVCWALNIINEENSVSGSLFGTEGGAQLSPLRLVKYIDGYPNIIEPKISQNNVFDEEIKHFIDCIRNNKEPMATLKHAITMMKMLDGIYKSASTGKSVNLKEGQNK